MLLARKGLRLYDVSLVFFRRSFSSSSVNRVMRRANYFVTPEEPKQKRNRRTCAEDAKILVVNIFNNVTFIYTDLCEHIGKDLSVVLVQYIPSVPSRKISNLCSTSLCTDQWWFNTTRNVLNALLLPLEHY